MQASAEEQVTLTTIRAAQHRIAGLVYTTPMLDWEITVDQTLRLKLENTQKTGSFKFRGAANAILSLREKGLSPAGVITASSGNHGQAVAAVADRVGLPATIVVPEDVVSVKAEAIRRFGAHLLYFGHTSEERIAYAQRLAEEEGLAYIAPYDDPNTISGQGTIGLELSDQCSALRRLFVPIGGGGLIAGIATAIKALLPTVEVVGVEPALADDTAASLAAGRIVSRDGSQTVADGLRTTHPGRCTFPIIQRHVDRVVTVSEAEISAAVQHLALEAKQVVEPSGAVSAAAALREGIRDGDVAVISGGNIDPQLLAAWLTSVSETLL
ncbi:MAG: threonine/serine dehydratase [Firmicutes bacterium]|nr:threonine/serine dehydratase [Bacillota bacterium]